MKEKSLVDSFERSERETRKNGSGENDFFALFINAFSRLSRCFEAIKAVLT